jgi:hypothetical protein
MLSLDSEKGASKKFSFLNKAAYCAAKQIFFAILATREYLFQIYVAIYLYRIN